MADMNPAPPELTVTASSDAGVAVLAVCGELDMSNAATLKAAIASWGAESSGRLVFDLSGLHFIDSAGIAVLLEAAERFESVSVRAPTRVVRRVIEVTGLTGVLPFEG
jgi:anti-sigma B factor antagonist